MSAVDVKPAVTKGTAEADVPASATSVEHERPFQFSVRTLLIAVTVLSFLLAIMRWHPTFGTILAWTVLLVAAHMMATAWGTRHRRLHPDAQPGANDDSRPVSASSESIAFAPPTPLHWRTRLGWLTGGCVIVGAITGGVLGTAVLVYAYWPMLSWPALGLGVCSACILGGFLGFIASTFLGISLRAWRAAIASQRR